ncbi:MAG: acetate--CoA ligase family protein [Thermoplasmata archaeon]|nr:acetate--CoA ligase family protein [Thermoplasmata archaeon]
MSERGEGLSGMFKPGSIAVIGASSNPDKLGFKLVDNIIGSGYTGKLYPVNVKGGSVCGLNILVSIESLPDGVDLAIIAVPAKHVAGSLEMCGEKKIPYAVVISAGFSEIGRFEEEKELVDIARKHGMRILGPNVFGFIYTPASLNAQFGPREITRGHVGIISQSGVMGAAMAERMFHDGIGISAVIATGNKADIGDEDLLEFLCDDKDTRVVLMYVEGVKDGRGFLEAGKRLAKKKPLIILKSGRTREGARAAMSHTASLAGEDRVFDGVIRQMGALRASTLKEGIDWARSLVNLPHPAKNNVFVITNGGGFAVLAVDRLQEQGIPLFKDVGWIEREMSDIFPGYAIFNNPMDMTAAPSYEDYTASLKKAMEEGSIGAVLGIYAPTSGVDVHRATRTLIETLGKPTKPVVLCTMGGGAVMDQIKELNRAGIPTFFFPEEAVSSLSALYRFEHYRERSHECGSICDWDVEGIGRILDGKKGFLSAGDSMKVLSLGAVPVPRFATVSNVDDAIVEGRKMNYPLVLKVSDPEKVHKTESGGVIIDIDDEEKLRGAFLRIGGSDELLLMEQVDGVEVITGGLRDPVFGPTVMFGLGGIAVEALNDVSFRVVPINDKDGAEMISDIRGGAVLEEFRGRKAVNKDAIVDVLKALGALLEDVEEIEEIEINPLMVTEKGAVAVDCRIKVR